LVALLPFVIYTGQWFAAASALITLAMFIYGLTVIHRDYGGSPIPAKFFWAPFVMLAMAPAIMLSNKINHTVNWRGRSYILNKKAGLEIRNAV
jgi:hypothetical protein